MEAKELIQRFKIINFAGEEILKATRLIEQIEDSEVYDYYKKDLDDMTVKLYEEIRSLKKDVEEYLKTQEGNSNVHSFNIRKIAKILKTATV